MANANDYTWTDPTTGAATAPGVGNAEVRTATAQVDAPNIDTGGEDRDYGTLSLAGAQQQANQAFSGLVAPMTTEEINAREEASVASTLQTAESIYDPNIAREKQTGASQVSTATGVVGQRQGFNISTAEQAFVASVQNNVQDRVREVENIKASYISQGNLDAADRADAQLQSLNEWNSEMTIAKANYALQLMAGNREEAQLGMSQAQLALQERAQQFSEGTTDRQLMMQAEELKLSAYKTALDTPVGEKFTVNGVEFVGLADSAGIDPSLIELTYDDQGYASGVSKITGEVLWKSTQPTGKTKTRAANTTVILNQQQAGALGDASAKLNAAMGTDGKTNTDTYITERQNYIQASGDKNATAFDESFQHLISDRSDDTKASELRSRIGLPITSSGMSDTEKQQLIGFGVDQATIDAADAAGLSFAELIGG